MAEFLSLHFSVIQKVYYIRFWFPTQVFSVLQFAGFSRFAVCSIDAEQIVIAVQAGSFMPDQISFTISSYAGVWFSGVFRTGSGPIIDYASAKRSDRRSTNLFQNGISSSVTIQRTSFQKSMCEFSPSG
ncbi:hypothetical protein NPIL_137851 [Nephila pilipes]|uniref:Uncharacterized protein n=1 Tax=Nephila pilipes TaxID=299642 RepID=A0A8X6NN16_NEPPI|nr:hypothetical protein NPIL_137851 [Nephila pilipes]